MINTGDSVTSFGELNIFNIFVALNNYEFKHCW